MIFLGLKGYGDLTILLGFLMRVNTRHTLIVRAGLYELACMYVGEKHNVVALKTIKDILPIYGLKEFRIISLFKTISAYLEIRKLISYYNSPILIDIKSKRNNLFFHYSKINYLPSAETIYTAYEIFFNLPKINPSATNSISKCIIFPFGSRLSKNTTEEFVLQTLHSNSIDRANSLVCVHCSHAKFLKDFKLINTIFYDSINELVGLIDSHHVVMSVDTFQLHLSILLGKKIIPIGSINSYFMPPNESIFIPAKK